MRGDVGNSSGLTRSVGGMPGSPTQVSGRAHGVTAGGASLHHRHLATHPSAGVPDRLTRIRLVAAGAPPGLQASRLPDASLASAVTPAGHRGYAATWFALAGVALVIYGLAVRKRLKGEPRP